MKRKQEHHEFLQKRIDVFMELMEKKMVSDVTLDLTCTEKLLKLLDTVVIKLEGGTEQDLEVLNVQTVPAPVKIPHEPPPAKVTKPIKEEDPEKKEESIKIEDDSDDKENKPEDEVNKEKDPEDEKKNEEEEKEENDKSGSDSDSSSSSSDSEDDDDDETPKKKKKKSKENKPEEPEQAEMKMDEDKTEDKDEVKDDSIEDGEDVKIKDINEQEEEKKKEEVTKNEPLQNVPVIDLVRDKSTVRELHKTSSIFLRNLPPTITKAEVEAMCKKYDGFLRVAIADPLSERRWFRRGWVTFKRDVNIKEICWNLNNIRLRDCELGAIVNRDLSRRIRSANGIALHRNVVRNDIKLCARIIHNLDEKHSLWREESEDQQQSTESFGLLSRNPVLQNITDFLIDEASAEEDELLGLTEEKKDNQESEVFDTDLSVIAVVDRLILYLRIVHSVDFYNHCEYPYEDEMPNRCGIIHARSAAPTNRVTATDIQDYIRNFESKLQTFLIKTTPIEGEELTKLGAKNADTEVEKFISANTQELAKDKWLCPLSGKKFKGPEFIRKHILNKHSEKIEEVKKEVEYFNNYLKDPKRPQLPEHPGSAKKAEGGGNPGGMGGFRSGGHFGASPYGGSPYSPYPMMAHRPRGGGFPRRGGGPDYRPIIHYRDLDAPREPDEFI